MFLFVQSWDIMRGKEEDYTDYVLREHLPVLKRIGLNVIGGFHVIVGVGPRISLVITCENLQDLQRALDTEDFPRITEKLQGYVVNYGSRIFKNTNRVNTVNYGIELGTWRFNQYYTLMPGIEKEYGEFLGGEYAKTLLSQGIRIKAEWQGVIGSGPNRILLEGVTQSISDIGRAIVSEEFGSLRHTLLTAYVKQYSSRILAPTGRVEIAFLLGEMTKSL